MKARSDEYTLFQRKLALVVLTVLLLALAWRVRNVLILIFIAGVLAGAIAPAVRHVQVRVRMLTRRRINRGAAVLLVFVPFVLVLVLIGFLTIPQLVAQGEQLSRDLPVLVEEKLSGLPGINADQLERSVRDWFARIPLYAYLASAATAVTSVVAILFMVAYMLVDAERLRNLVLVFFPTDERSERRRTIRRISRRLSGWLGGQLTLAAIVGGATFVTLVLLRIPYALPLALIAAIGEMVPVIGPVVGAVPAVAVGLFQSDWQFWGVLVAAVLIQQVENYFLVPRLLGRKVSVSPLAVFIAFITGATLLGLVGALMAVPAVAIVQLIFEESFLRKRERRRDTARAGTLVRPDGE